MVSKSRRRREAIERSKNQSVAPKPRAQRRNRPTKARPMPSERQSSFATPGEASYRFRHREYAGTYKKGLTTLQFGPAGSGLTLLDQIASIYQMYVLHSLVVHTTVMCGMTSDGDYTVSYSYEFGSKPTDEKGVMRPDPKLSAAIFQSGSLKADVSRCMKQKRMLIRGSSAQTEDSLACYVNMWVNGDKSIKVWIQYDLTFYGLAPPQASKLGDVFFYRDSGVAGWLDADGKAVDSLPDISGPVEVVIESKADTSKWNTTIKLLENLFGPTWVQKYTQSGLNYAMQVVPKFLASKLPNLPIGAIVRITPYPFQLPSSEWLRLWGGEETQGASSSADEGESGSCEEQPGPSGLSPTVSLTGLILEEESF